jgi:signal transduction histidine kinase/DNA-binding CsgD family transcriptional regulator
VHKSPARTAVEDAATAAEAERRRMAEALQRTVVEPLNLLLAQANAYEQALSANPQARMAVSALASLARQALQQARDLEANLSPTVLEALGLEPALEALAGQVMRAYGLRVALALERSSQRLPHRVELALFRLAQDALDRAVRHARASCVTIRLERQDEYLALTLSDDGTAAPDEEVLPAACRQIEHLGGTVETGVGPHGGLELTVGFAIEAPVQLTLCEMDVIQLLAEGLSNKEIAQRLAISPRTVNFHLDHIYSKLGVTSRTEAAVYALRHGWDFHSTR